MDDDKVTTVLLLHALSYPSKINISKRLFPFHKDRTEDLLRRQQLVLHHHPAPTTHISHAPANLNQPCKIRQSTPSSPSPPPPRPCTAISPLTSSIPHLPPQHSRNTSTTRPWRNTSLPSTTRTMHLSETNPPRPPRPTHLTPPAHQTSSTSHPARSSEGALLSSTRPTAKSPPGSCRRWTGPARPTSASSPA